MSDKPKLVDVRPHVPLYAQGDIVQHKTSKQPAVILSVQDAVIHNKSCPNAQPFSCFNPQLCNCASTFTGEYTISAGFYEEMIVDECVLESV